MPQIKARGISKEKLCTISSELVDELESIIGCPKSYFTIELLDTTFIIDGEVSAGYPFVEIAWFDRGQEIQDKVALCITKLIKKAGYENVDIFFTVFKENCYYENGEHF